MHSNPPLNWLKSFQLAARHLNLSRAAIEAGVTHAAISRQVSQLEDRLGISLCERSNTGLCLTTQGTKLAAKLNQAFESIDAAIDDLKEDKPAGFTLTVLPSFAVHWLVAKMPDFYSAHPEFEVRLLTTRRLIDFDKEEIDIGLRYGNGDWPDLESVLMLEDQLILATSPELAREIDVTNSDSFHGRIAYSYNEDHVNWANWFAKAGLEIPNLKGLPGFDDTTVAIQSALRGQCVILGRSSLIERELTEGRLIQLSPLTLPSPQAMYLVYLRRNRNRPPIKAFRGWILKEVEKSSDWR
jgi:LysR family transcriptional regulator, glycine cleavage system transcriptional activator